MSNCINCGSALVSNECLKCGRPSMLEDLDYLNKIEKLAHILLERAYQAGLPIDLNAAEEGREELLVAFEELARHLRHWHYEGDGCVKQFET